MENNTVEDNSVPTFSHHCNLCSKWMQFNTTEEISNENEIFLFWVYMCPKCENKVYVLDYDKEYYQDIYKHLKEKGIIPKNYKKSNEQT